jgi:hypothetical protein
MHIDTTTAIIVALIVVAIVIAAGVYMRRRSSEKLRTRFGPEYSRTVDEAGGKRAAEAQLHKREKRVEGFDIRALTAADRDRYVASWRKVQGRFVDNPKDAVTHADDLLGQVMNARGYPVTDFDQRSADLSVDHPLVVQNYRAAHDIALRHERGEAGTEDLRQAMIHFKALFDELVGEPETAALKAAS